MFGRKAKVIEHGYFFKKNMLETRCECGCVYRTPKEDVDIINIDDYYGPDVLFKTDCPECCHRNTQSKREMEKERCENE